MQALPPQRSRRSFRHPSQPAVMGQMQAFHIRECAAAFSATLLQPAVMGQNAGLPPQRVAPQLLERTFSNRPYGTKCRLFHLRGRAAASSATLLQPAVMDKMQAFHLRGSRRSFWCNPSQPAVKGQNAGSSTSERSRRSFLRNPSPTAVMGQNAGLPPQRVAPQL
ncbi:hypothetical protein JTE90_000875 [Oedothorax gibbosus]|uniref:Uncharacterized protein n=1 Tax=Oedothorax gibbosus TaxID=931172 RepID=A0AAV6VSD0_9ARAC|nr:hypothetical protein JTE90_000875 [Oedothorax gibbosus]